MESAGQAKTYQKKRQFLQLAGLFLTPALLVIVFTFPFSLTFKTFASGLTQNGYGVVVIYFFIYSIFMLIVDFPLSVYSGYILEKKFNLSNHTLASWFLDFFKKTVLSFIFSLLLILGLYALIENFPERWWLFAWAGFAGVSYMMGKVFPVLIVPLFYKYGKVEDESLRQRIFALSARYGLPLENLYSINLSRTTKKANAAFMGMGKTKRVVLSDTLLENFTGDEIETVVAHELGHFKHKDIWKQLVLGMSSSLLGFWIVSKLIGPAANHFGFEGAGDVSALPVLFLLFYIFHLCLMPLQHGFSRWMERAADRFSLTAFPHKDAFISCMNKLAKVNLADPDPHPVYEWFFYDHPAIRKRIQMAREFKL